MLDRISDMDVTVKVKGTLIALLCSQLIKFFRVSDINFDIDIIPLIILLPH
jgi:hypothetical protein